MIFRRRKTRIEIEHTAVRLTVGGAAAGDSRPEDRPWPASAMNRPPFAPEAPTALLRAEPVRNEPGGWPFDTTFHTPGGEEK